MATDRIVIDASALASINYNTYFADFFAGLGAATRKYYGGAGTSGSQVGFSYGSDVSDPYVLMTGTNVGYDMNTHTYAGSIDTINFGSIGPGTVVPAAPNGLVTGVVPGLSISNLGVSVAPGGEMVVDPDAPGFNAVYSLLSLIRDAGDPTKYNGQSVEWLYKILAKQAQDFTGTAGNDSYTGTAFDDLIKGGVGDDILSGSAGDDEINGGDGNDVLDGGEGNDTINGGAGNDTIRASNGTDTIDGGDGADTVIFAGSVKDFTVSVAAGGGITISNGTWSTTLTNVETIKFEAPKFAPSNLALSNAAVNENVAVDTVVGNLSASDVDNDPLTYSLKSNPGNLFAIDAQNRLVVKGALNYESAKSHTVVVEVFDGTTKVEKAFTINVKDVNEGPSAATLSKNTVAESAKVGTVVGTLSATDPEKHALTFSLASGSSGFFQIDGNKLVVSKALDFETVKSHVVKLVATDALGLKSEVNVNVGVTNVNEAPSATSLSKSVVAENLKVGTVVGSLKAVDPDGGAVSYSLASGSSSFFKIVGDKLVISKAIDYETAQSHIVKLVATDSGKLSSTTTVKIGVADVLETIKGTNKAESLKGGIGADKIDGYAGNDSLSGGAGSDKLWGGLGADKLNGGSGADTFIFKAKAESTATARDTIYDFVGGKDGDRIDLSGFDANDKLGVQDFAFIGSKSFSGKAGELRFDKAASDSYVYADTNGDKKADFVLHFDDAITFTRSDFLF